MIRYIEGTAPKELVEIGWNEYCDEVPICPECEAFLKIGYDYCPKCGCALDWDDYPTEEQYYREDDYDEPLYDDYSENSRA